MEADGEGLRSIMEEKCDRVLALNLMWLVVCDVDEPAFQRDRSRVVREELDGGEEIVRGA